LPALFRFEQCLLHKPIVPKGTPLERSSMEIFSAPLI
jgi:hypothetical protein